MGIDPPGTSQAPNSPKLSRNPSKSVVSAGEKRSAEDGNGGGVGNKAGSNVKSNSAILSPCKKSVKVKETVAGAFKDRSLRRDSQETGHAL